MLGAAVRPRTVAFLGWFGPRGLASIVFAILLEEGSDLPHEETILVTAYVTVGLSVLLHGLTAAPLAQRYARWFASSHPPGRQPVTESVEVSEPPWRSAGARRPG